MQQFLSILRALMLAVGGFLVGHHFLGTTVDAPYWDVFTGGIMAIVAGVWSWRDKLLSTEQKVSFARSTITFIAGIVVSAGWLTDNTVNTILGVITAIMPFIIGSVLKGKVKA